MTSHNNHTIIQNIDCTPVVTAAPVVTNTTCTPVASNSTSAACVDQTTAEIKVDELPFNATQ